MRQDYNHNCCWVLQASLFHANFAIIDTAEYLADMLFVRHRVRVRYGKEFTLGNSPYRVIVCSCKKKDVPRFLDAIRELPNKMLLCGYPDYLNFCTELCDQLLAAAAKGGEEQGAEDRSPAQAE